MRKQRLRRLARQTPLRSEISHSKGTAEPALPGRQCRPPLGGDATGGAGGGQHGR